MITADRLTRSLTAPRFLRWIVLPHLVFFAVAWLTDAPPLIAVLNSVDIALSVAVCIAFLPSALEAIFDDRPADKAVFLTLGIFCGWEGNALRAGWSMAWRALGMPDWFANTDITSYILFVIGAGALFHLLAPGALDEDVPPKRWIKIGAWIGAGVFLAIVLTYLHDIEGYIHGLAPPHDRAASPAGFQDL
jgi:hypothetical protein